MSDNKTYKGSCFCGAVELTVSGDPLFMGYCHCESCRHWSAAPLTAYVLWQPEAVQITKGEENIVTYNKTEMSYRKSCRLCGGHLLTDHKTMGIFDVYPSVTPELNFIPDMHVHYGETVLPMKDGLPKFKDLPAEAGGSGEMVSE